MLKTLLIANRGEIAIRIARSAAEMGIATVAIFSEDDAQSLHTRKADKARGPARFGRGRLSRRRTDRRGRARPVAMRSIRATASSARTETSRGAAPRRELSFVGPSPETLDLFGDKARARAGREDQSTRVARDRGRRHARRRREVSDRRERPDHAQGAGGRRRARHAGRARGAGELEQAFERCRSEAQQAFGNGALYAEEFFERARHIEVQIVGDGTGAVSHLWDRECSLQRQRQKLIESAPALGLPEKLRQRLLDAAIALGKASHYKNLGTIEFLVDAGGSDRFAFIEANPRLQVEHTVTEEVTGLDLVRIQLDIAGGRALHDLHLEQKNVPSPRGVALQARVNLETMNADGSAAGRRHAHDL
jgi:pyruvate carboxylase